MRGNKAFFGGMRQGPMRQGGERAGALHEKLREGLRGAILLEGQGKIAEAAKAYETLAAQADGRGVHAAATRTAIHATRCHLAAGATPDEILACVDTALSYATEIPNRRRVARRFSALADLVAEQGHAEVADGIRAAARERFGFAELPDAAAPTAPVNRAQRRLLPKTCPTCGAPIRPDEVEWDDGAPSCPYCEVGLA